MSDDGPNVADAIQGLADATEAVSRAIHRLGNADASTPMGGLEALGLVVKEAGEAIQSGLNDVADAIRETAGQG